MNKLKINGYEVTNPMTVQRFQELVQEDRDIMEEAEISLDEIMETCAIEAAREALDEMEEDFFDN